MKPTETKAFKAAAKMPAGKRHHADGEDYRIKSSEVVEWLVQQPEILQAMFDYYRDRRHPAILFDHETGTWKGRDS